MVGGRRFQHTFGRSIQTKILDAVWNERKRGLNIRDLSRKIRQSYVYTTLAVASLSEAGFILKRRNGVEIILLPAEAHPVMKWAAQRRPKSP